MHTCNADGGQALWLRRGRILPHERLAVQKHILHSGAWASLHRHTQSPEHPTAHKLLCVPRSVTAERQSLTPWTSLYVRASSTLENLATCNGSALFH